MSDEEELRRAAGFSEEAYGEVLVHLPDEANYDQDLRELGLLDDE